MKKKIAWSLGAVFVIAIIAVVLRPGLLLLPMVLSGRYTGMQRDTPFIEAHGKAVNTFVNSKGFGISRMQRKGFWNERSVLFEGVSYVPVAIKLIGLTPEGGNRYFEDTHPPEKRTIPTAVHRKLSAVELAAVERIKLGDALYVQIPSMDGDRGMTDVRVIAPIRATSSCLECHKGKVGDLLGAFDYHLIREEPSH